MVASAEGQVIAASWYGKVKTVFQMVAIPMFIVKDSPLIELFGPEFVQFFQVASWAVMGVAVVLTLMSMVDYFRHAADVLVGPWTGDDAIAMLAADADAAAEDAADATTD